MSNIQEWQEDGKAITATPGGDGVVRNDLDPIQERYPTAPRPDVRYFRPRRLVRAPRIATTRWLMFAQEDRTLF